MPSTEEAFGVAYIEAMAAGVPAIGCRGEPGPEEIAAAGDGFLLVPPGDIERLTPAHRRAALRPPAAARGRPARPRDRRGELHLGALRRADARRLPSDALGPSEARSCSSPATRPPTASGALARLHEREEIELALFGGRSHATAAPDPAGELPFPHRARAPARAVRARRERALPRGRLPHRRPRRAAGAGPARARARVPLILWASLWAHPRTRRPRAQLPGAAAPVPLGRCGRHLRPARQRLRQRPRRAQRARRPAGGRQRLLARAAGPPTAERSALARQTRRTRSCSSGAPSPRRALQVLLEAWRGRAASTAPSAALVLVGARAGAGRAAAAATARRRRRSCALGRSRRRGCATSTRPATCWSCRRSRPRTFREPWGLVVNEAMNQRAGRDRQRRRRRRRRRAGARRRQRPDRARRRQRRARRRDRAAGGATPSCARGSARPARRTCAAYSHDAWAEGFSRALASLGVSRERW